MTTMSDDEAFSGEHLFLTCEVMCVVWFLTAKLFPGPNFMPKVAAPTQSYSLSAHINEI